jgi:hypothetical protein
MRKQNKSSLISLQNVSIDVMVLKEQRKEVLMYYLERPYASMTLLDMFGQNFREHKYDCS